MSRDTTLGRGHPRGHRPVRPSPPVHVQHAVEEAIAGKSDVVRITLPALLAEGHLLIENIPHVGKTMLAKALARAARYSDSGSSSRLACFPVASPGSVSTTGIATDSSSPRPRARPHRHR